MGREPSSWVDGVMQSVSSSICRVQGSNSINKIVEVRYMQLVLLGTYTLGVQVSPSVGTLVWDLGRRGGIELEYGAMCRCNLYGLRRAWHVT